MKVRWGESRPLIVLGHRVNICHRARNPKETGSDRCETPLDARSDSSIVSDQHELSRPHILTPLLTNVLASTARKEQFQILHDDNEQTS